MGNLKNWLTLISYIHRINYLVCKNNGSLSVVEALVNAKADLEKQDKDGNTALIWGLN